MDTPYGDTGRSGADSGMAPSHVSAVLPYSVDEPARRMVDVSFSRRTPSSRLSVPRMLVSSVSCGTE